jgi:GTP cyclohydrolase IA
MLDRLGEDVRREGLERTPERVDARCGFLTSGYQMDVKKVVNGALFAVKYDEMVIMKDIEFFSMCEHHMLPFFGKVHVAYIPRDRVIGLSKLPRLVDVFARRLQIQERMTQQIAQTIQDLIDPMGVGVICEARHFCMMMRGVEKQHSGGDQRHAGRFPQSQRDPRRISGAGGQLAARMRREGKHRWTSQKFSFRTRRSTRTGRGHSHERSSNEGWLFGSTNLTFARANRSATLSNPAYAEAT